MHTERNVSHFPACWPGIFTGPRGHTDKSGINENHYNGEGEFRGRDTADVIILPPPTKAGIWLLEYLLVFFASLYPTINGQLSYAFTH